MDYYKTFIDGMVLSNDVRVHILQPPGIAAGNATVLLSSGEMDALGHAGYFGGVMVRLISGEIIDTPPRQFDLVVTCNDKTVLELSKCYFKHEENSLLKESCDIQRVTIVFEQCNERLGDYGDGIDDRQ